MKLSSVPLTFTRDAVEMTNAIFDDKRPDFICWLNRRLVLLGEGKANDTELGTAYSELIAKMKNPHQAIFGANAFFLRVRRSWLTSQVSCN